MNVLAIAATRIEPTPEEVAIYQRHLVRLLRASRAAGHDNVATLGIVNRWTLDVIGLSHGAEAA